MNKLSLKVKCSKCTFKEECREHLKIKGSKLIYDTNLNGCVGTIKSNISYYGIKEFEFYVPN